MATVHVATTIMKLITSTGAVIDKNSATIGERANSSPEIRVDVTGFPTIPDYLRSEYAAGFALRHMDQTYIITDK
jgi:hypothetical protein